MYLKYTNYNIQDFLHIYHNRFNKLGLQHSMFGFAKMSKPKPNLHLKMENYKLALTFCFTDTLDQFDTLQCFTDKFDTCDALLINLLCFTGTFNKFDTLNTHDMFDTLDVMHIHLVFFTDTLD